MTLIALKGIKGNLPIIKDEYVNGKTFIVTYHGELCRARYKNTCLLLFPNTQMTMNHIVIEFATKDGVLSMTFTNASISVYPSVADVYLGNKLKQDELIDHYVSEEVWLKELNSAFIPVLGEPLGNVVKNADRTSGICRYVWSKEHFCATPTFVLSDNEIHYGKNGFEVSETSISRNKFDDMYLSESVCFASNVMSEVTEFADEDKEEEEESVSVSVNVNLSGKCSKGDAERLYKFIEQIKIY